MVSPIDGEAIGTVTAGDEAIVISAMAAATAGFPSWDATPREARAAALMRAGDALEHDRGRLIALCSVRGYAIIAMVSLVVKTILASHGGH